MKEPGTFSPMQLALWAGAGSLLVSSNFLLGLWFAPPSRSGRMIFLVPAAVGLAITVLAEVRLSRGMKRNLWDDIAVESLRKLLEYPIWMFLIVTAGCVLIASMVVWRPDHNSLFLSVLFPIQTLMYLSAVIKPKVDYVPQGMRIDWARSAPIRSEHWGQPGQGGSAE